MRMTQQRLRQGETSGGRSRHHGRAWPAPQRFSGTEWDTRTAHLMDALVQRHRRWRHLGEPTGRPTRLFATQLSPCGGRPANMPTGRVALPLCRQTLCATGPGVKRKAVIGPAVAVVAQAAVSIAVPSTARTAVVTSVPKAGRQPLRCQPRAAWQRAQRPSASRWLGWRKSRPPAQTASASTISPPVSRIPRTAPPRSSTWSTTVPARMVRLGRPRQRVSCAGWRSGRVLMRCWNASSATAVAGWACSRPLMIWLRSGSGVDRHRRVRPGQCRR